MDNSSGWTSTFQYGTVTRAPRYAMLQAYAAATYIHSIYENNDKAARTKLIKIYEENN